MTLLSPAARRALAKLAGREPDPLDIYTPSLPQLRFHRSSHRRRLLRAGNQSGKTEAGAREAWYLALGDSPFRQLDPAPTIGLVMCADWRSYVDVVSAKMWACAPLSMLAPGTDWQPGRGFKHQRVRLLNGSEILFRSAEQGAQGIAGITAGWVWWDEVPVQDLWGEVTSRIAVSGGPLYNTMSPIGRPVRWYREHIEGDPEATPPKPPAEDWEQHTIRLRVEDMPWRTAENLAEQIAGYGPWERAQRVDGAWEGVAHDRRFTAFDAHHIIDPDPEAEFHEIRLGLDHGEGDGKQIAIVAGVDTSGRRPSVTVLAESVMSAGSTPRDVARGVVGMLAGLGLSPHQVSRAFGDVNSAGLLGAGTRYNAHIEAALAELYGTRESPIHIETPSKRGGSVDAGEAAMHHAMLDGRWRVWRACRVVTAALRHYQGPRDKEHKDPVDAVRYSVADLLLDPKLDARPIWRG